MTGKSSLLLAGLLFAGAGAKEMNIFEKWRYNHDRKEAVKEWKTIIQGRDANYQQALLKFETFKTKFHATNEEIEQFRHWKKSVRSTTTPDGIIFNPQTYVDELNQFRTARLPIPNSSEEPLFYPAPAAAGTKVYLQTPNPSGAGDWKSMGYRGSPKGPGQGATGNGAATGVAIDPNNPAIVYAAIRNGGLWKSTDYGVSYIPLTDYFQSPQIEGVGIGTNNSKVLYLSQPNRIWFSDDGGMSWEDRSNGYSGSSDEIHVDPTDANRALAASNNGLFLTTDGGLNWVKVIDGIFREIETTSTWHTLLVTKDPATSDALQAPVFYLSTDKGATWTEKTVPTTQGNITRMYLGLKEKATPNELVIYSYLIKCNSTNPSNFAGLWKSTDRGNSFSEVKNPNYAYPNGITQISGNSTSGYTELGETYGGVNPYWTSSWVGEFFVDPTNENNLVTMREKCWYSVDGGQTWGYGPSYGEVAWADRRFCTANPTKDSLYFCDDGGLWAVPFATLFPWTGTQRSSVVTKNGNIAAPEGTNMTTSTYNKDVFMTGGQDVGQVFQRNGNSFHTAFADIYRGKICPTNDSVYWTAGFTAKISDTGRVELLNQVEPDHFNPQRLYGFTRSDVLMRTRAGENAWSAPVGRGAVYADTLDLSTTGVASWNSWTFEQSRANGERAYIGDEKGKRLFMTTNLSAVKPTWTQVVSAPALGRYRIATHPFNEKVVAVAGDKAVWISRDGGTTWEELTGYPASGTINIFFDKNTQEGLYVCNSMTVWYRDETLSNWIEFNKGLPLQNISEMEIRYYPDGDSRLWLSKYGRGVWSTPLYSTGKVKPIKADFTFHGKTGDGGVFRAGDTIQFCDLSAGTITGRNWVVTGPQSKSVQNDSMPKFTFTTAGIYNVALKVTGANGVDSCYKAGFFKISESVKAVDSTPTVGTGGAWFLGIGSVTVNGVAHNSSGNTNLCYEDETDQTPFTNFATDSATVVISPAYNDGTWGVSNARVYIDYNNSGSFDTTELVYLADSPLQGHTFKFKAPAAVVKNSPLRMRVLANRLSKITNAYQSQVDQGQVEDHIILFKTPNPSVTVNASAVGTDSLTFTATVTGATGVIDQGFVYTVKNSVPSLAASPRISCGIKGFSSGVGAVPKNQTYYVRAYVIDKYGTWYSAVDTVTVAPFTQPLLEVLTPTFNTQTRTWSATGRIHAENGTVSQASVEYGVDGSFDNVIPLSITGVRNQWDSIAKILPNIPRYSQANYRIRATINGKQYFSPVRKFSSEKGLYAYWTFDESGTTAFDYSGNNHPVTLGSSLTRTTDDRNGSALAFDSIGDIATIGLNNLPQPFTLMFRVKRTAQSSVNYAVLLEGPSRRVDLEVWNNTHKLGIAIPQNYDRASTYMVPLNEWHNIAMVGSSDSVKLFIDGTYHSTLPAAGYTLPLTTFGRFDASMIGLLDEVKVYARTLDSTDIADAQKMVQYVTFDPIANHTFGDPAFTVHAVSSKGAPIRFEVVSGSSAVTLDSNAVSIVAGGTVVVRAIADGSATMLPDTALQTFTVNRAVQNVTLNVIADCKAGTSPFTLTALSSKGTAIRYEVVFGENCIQLNGATVTPVLDGAVQIRAIADETAQFLADTAVQSFTVTPGDQVNILKKKQELSGSITVEISPNPARHGINSGIRFSVLDRSLRNGSVVLFDHVGNRVAQLELVQNDQGWSAEWNMTNSGGQLVGSGSYRAVFQLIAHDGTKKVSTHTVGVGK